MNKYLLSALSVASLVPANANPGKDKTPVPNDEAKRPNIILFLVDDMGWQDTSLPFWTEKTPYNEMYETPNMERLAEKGMVFTQAYACNISSATRCSLITGANNARHRVTNWTLERDKTTDRQSPTIELPDWNYNGVSQVEGTPHTYVGTSFVDLLRQHGYHTIHCGKAHWGAIDTPGENPTHWGFEVNIAGHAAGGLATYLSERNYGHTRDGKAYSLMSIPGLEDYWGTGTFATEALTREAIKALDKAKQYNQPFYLYMAHYAVHVPVDKDMRFFPKYVRKGLSDKEAAYASLVEGMDKSLGDLMDWLEKNGEADNTIFIFMSDLYEGGIREPMIVRWPGVVEGGTRCDKYVMIEDFYPTLLEMAGVNPKESQTPVDGVSFLPLLQGTGDPSRGRALVWNFPNIWGNDGPGINLNCAIRKDEWKLVYYYETGRKELYNIPQDIGEKHDLSAEHPDIVRKLSKELGEYLRRVDAQRPSFKASGKPCPWPDEIQ